MNKICRSFYLGWNDTPALSFVSPFRFVSLSRGSCRSHDYPDSENYISYLLLHRASARGDVVEKSPLIPVNV